MAVFPDIGDEGALRRFLRDGEAVQGALEALGKKLHLEEPLERFERGSVLVAASGKLVIKVFPPGQLRFAETEWAALSAAHGRLPVPTPKPIELGLCDGWAYVLMGRLEGEELVEIWPRLSEEARLGLGSELGHALKALHQLPPPDRLFRLDWLEHVEQATTLIERRQRTLGCPQRVVEHLVPFLRRAALSVGPRGFGFVHTEVMLEHLLVLPSDTGWTLSGLFDFEPSWIAPVDYELPSIGLFVARGEPRVFRSVLEAMGVSPDPELPERVLALCLVHRYANLAWYFDRLGGPRDGDMKRLAHAWFGLGRARE